MCDVIICRAQEEDAPYIDEKLGKYLLDPTNANWQQFFVVRYNNKTVAFGRVIDHTDFFEITSLGSSITSITLKMVITLLFFKLSWLIEMKSSDIIYTYCHN